MTAPYNEGHAFAKTLGGLIDELAKQAHPHDTPVVALEKFMASTEGKEAYVAYRRALSAARVD